MEYGLPSCACAQPAMLLGWFVDSMPPHTYIMHVTTQVQDTVISEHTAVCLGTCHLFMVVMWVLPEAMSSHDGHLHLVSASGRVNLEARSHESNATFDSWQVDIHGFRDCA